MLFSKQCKKIVDVCLTMYLINIIMPKIHNVQMQRIYVLRPYEDKLSKPVKCISVSSSQLYVRMTRTTGAGGGGLTYCYLTFERFFFPLHKVGDKPFQLKGTISPVFPTIFLFGFYLSPYCRSQQFGNRRWSVPSFEM